MDAFESKAYAFLIKVKHISSDIFLHRDKTFMPQNPTAWSACNFLGSINKKACLTCWINLLQIRNIYFLYKLKLFYVSGLFNTCVLIQKSEAHVVTGMHISSKAQKYLTIYLTN